MEEENKIEIDEQQQNIFENELETYLQIYCEELNISDPSKMSQARFVGYLMYAYNHIFKNRDIFEQKKTINRSVNLDIALEVAITYISMCYRYEKVANVHGFCKLTGISRETIDNWKNDIYRADEPQAKAIWQLLNSEYEETLESALVSGGRNPLGIIAILNKRFSWKENAKLLDDTPKQSIGFNDLPQLTGNDLPTLPEK